MAEVTGKVVNNCKSILIIVKIDVLGNVSIAKSDLCSLIFHLQMLSFALRMELSLLG